MLPTTLPGRFRKKIVEQEDGCWIWTASTTGGYGYFKDQGKLVRAHRFAYQLLVGDIPAELEIDHLCRMSACVNPAHLEAVPHSVNCRRGDGGQNSTQKTRCPLGHPYDIANTYHWGGRRYCRACRTAGEARRNLNPEYRERQRLRVRRDRERRHLANLQAV